MCLHDAYHARSSIYLYKEYIIALKQENPLGIDTAMHTDR